MQSFFSILAVIIGSLSVVGFSGSTPTPATVWISKPDGAVSCEPQSGISLTVAAEELKKKGVETLESRKGTDGKMHIQSCGASKGTTNEFLIREQDLNQAVALEYKILRIEK